MYISPELLSLLEGPWADVAQEIRANKLRADLDYFIEGGNIAIGQDPYKKKRTAYMVRLDPAYDEVWQIRSRDPKPGIRVFGRFADRDVFVALTWSERTPLGGPGNLAWIEAINLCKSEWRKLFPAYQPISGSDYNDYLSGGFFLV
jgi:hypothetical protein